jgi:hypothetical protein
MNLVARQRYFKNVLQGTIIQNWYVFFRYLVRDDALYAADMP